MRTARTRRRAVFRTSAVITTAALAAAAAPAAFADDTVPETVDHVVTQDDGTLAVAMNGTEQPLWLRITVKSSTAADAATLYTTDDFTGGHTTSAVRLPDGTAYGDYPVDVDFRLAQGPVQHWTAADHAASAVLDYRKHASVTAVTADRASTDYDHRTVVFSGAVQELDPATGQLAAAPAGTHVRVTWQVNVTGSMQSGAATADTDATGSFSLPVMPGGYLYDGSAVVVDPDADTAADPAPAPLPEVQLAATRYRISATPSRTRVHAGSQFTMSGSVQRYTGGVWVPFPGAQVVTATGYPYNSTGTAVSGLLGSGTTAADGTFSYANTARRTGTDYTFLHPSPYLTLNDDPNPLYVPTAGSITSPAFAVDRYDKVTTTGRLYGDCAQQNLYLQYSPNGSTGWQSFKRGTTGYKSGGYCSYKIQEYGAWDGYYRVYHPESDQMLAVTTSAHRLHRTRTAMSLTMTPTRPYRNAKLTATGTVTQLTSKGWVRYAGAHVVLVFRPKGDTQWYWVLKGYTNSYGRYTLNTKAYGDGTWAAYLDANSTHYYSETKQVYVDVR